MYNNYIIIINNNYVNTQYLFTCILTDWWNSFHV